jgi:hypothetical protein
MGAWRLLVVESLLRREQLGSSHKLTFSEMSRRRGQAVRTQSPPDHNRPRHLCLHLRHRGNRLAQERVYSGWISLVVHKRRHLHEQPLQVQAVKDLLGGPISSSQSSRYMPPNPPHHLLRAMEARSGACNHRHWRLLQDSQLAQR